MLKDVSTLSVSTRSYRDEVVMADFLRVLPGVENLALLFPELFPVRVRPYLDAMKIRVLRSLRLSHCKATASEFVDLCKIHSRTLKELHFQDLSLMEGHVEPFFESISDILLTWEQFTLKGYLVELENETCTYHPCTMVNYGQPSLLKGWTHRDLKNQICARQESARRSIDTFVTRKSQHFPRELLDNNASGMQILNNAETRPNGITVALSGSLRHERCFLRFT